MANELRLQVDLRYNKNGRIIEEKESIWVDVAGDNVIRNIQEVGTSEEALQSIDGGTQGYLLIKNLDSTNYVEVGLTGEYTAKLKAGEIALFRCAGTVFAKANTAACDVDYILIEL